MPETGRTTIRRPHELSETRTSQTREIQDLIIGTAELRESAAELHSEAAALDESALSLQVDERASQLAQEDVLDLLNRARADFGLTWEDLASLIGVSSAALRKWRRGEAVSAQNRHRLARVLAFCESLTRRDPRIADPLSGSPSPLWAAPIYEQWIYIAPGSTASCSVSLAARWTAPQSWISSIRTGGPHMQSVVAGPSNRARTDLRLSRSVKGRDPGWQSNSISQTTRRRSTTHAATKSL